MTVIRWPWVTAVIAVIAFAGCTAAEQRPVAGTDPPPSPSASAAPWTPANPVTEPIDSRDWTTYTSDHYGFKVGHPPDWSEIPASRSWKVGDTGHPMSPAHDTFQSPSAAVSVSVWQVPLGRSTRVESTADIAAWVEEYCQGSGNAPCTGIRDRAVELCLEKWDCHPGLLVPFESDVQAFFSAGFYDAGAMTVVAVWRGESAPAATPYGGSQRLLEAFLSTMAVWPASTPRDERYCYGRPPVALDCQASD